MPSWSTSRGAPPPARARPPAGPRDEGGVAGPALAPTVPEPFPADDPLWTDPRVLISPHIGGFGSVEAGRRIAALFERNVGLFRAGKPLGAQASVQAGGRPGA